MFILEYFSQIEPRFAPKSLKMYAQNCSLNPHRLSMLLLLTLFFLKSAKFVESKMVSASKNESLIQSMKKSEFHRRERQYIEFSKDQTEKLKQVSQNQFCNKKKGGRKDSQITIIVSDNRKTKLNDRFLGSFIAQAYVFITLVFLYRLLLLARKYFPKGDRGSENGKLMYLFNNNQNAFKEQHAAANIDSKGKRNRFKMDAKVPHKQRRKTKVRTSSTVIRNIKLINIVARFTNIAHDRSPQLC